MARKTKEDALKTRAAILDAAIELFAEKGITMSTLANIAKKAGVTRGAVYHHFTNKDALIHALKELLFKPFKELERQIDNPDDIEDPLGLMHNAELNFFIHIKENPKLLKLLRVFLTKSESTATLHQVFADKLTCQTEGLVKIESLLEKAVEKRQLPESFNTRLGAIATKSFFDGLLHNWLIFPDQLTVDEEIPNLLNGFQRALKSVI